MATSNTERTTIASKNTTTDNNISGSGSTEYTALLNDIKTTINRNDALFKQIQQSNYPDAGTYTSDLLNYKIDTQIADLSKARNTVWDFVNKKYQENSKLRSFYFNEIRKSDTHITELEQQQQELIDTVEKQQLQTTTSNARIKQQKYLFDKKTYYMFLYKILTFIQIVILMFLILCLIGIIKLATCLIIIVIILLATLAFVGYYVFYVNIGRSTFSWGKFEHANDAKSKGSQCIDTSGITPEDKKRAEIDIAVQSIISENHATCADPQNKKNS